MFKRFRRPEVNLEESFTDRQLATATLLVEIARADFEIHPREQDAIRRLLRGACGLDPARAAELVARAEREAEEVVSLYEFTRRLNLELSREEKTEIVEMLWRVAFADGQIDKYEEHLVRKVADLLYVPHRNFIRAKLKTIGEPSPSPSAASATGRRPA